MSLRKRKGSDEVIHSHESGFYGFFLLLSLSLSRSLITRCPPGCNIPLSSATFTESLNGQLLLLLARPTARPSACIPNSAYEAASLVEIPETKGHTCLRVPQKTPSAAEHANHKPKSGNPQRGRQRDI